ncbi:MAG: hypothetical protein U0271_32810 [Polyangiaceae bacterium]
MTLGRALALSILAVLFAACSDDSGSGAGGSDTGGSDTGGTANNGGAGGAANTGGGGGSFGGGLPDGPSSSRLTLHPLGTVPGANMGYAEYLPPGYGDGQKRPLLVFQHGIGESGSGSELELPRLFNTGLPPLIQNDAWPSDRPFIVLMTQHNAPPFTSCHTLAEIEGFFAFAKAHYDVDPSRVYLTGLSCGAIGGWDYLGVHTNEDVAAAVLIAGDGRNAFAQAGCALGNVAIWAFHGDADPTVDPQGSIQPIQSLLNCTSPAPVDTELTLYPGVGHDSWDQTYDLSAGNDIYAWLLSHHN